MTLIEELDAILSVDWPHEDDAGKLARILYDRCYTESVFERRHGQPAPEGDGQLGAALAKANQGRAGWDEGWKIDQLLEGGRILARKGGAARSFQPGEFITHRGLGSGPEAGAAVSIAVSVGSSDLQPGYYYAFSETVSDFGEGERMVRFFWNVTREGTAPLMEALTHELNRFQIPFRLKITTRAAEFPRQDAAVLYFDARYYPIVALAVETVHARIQSGLNTGTPLFTKRLADGLAFAEDPGESFGENRMNILAAAIVAGRTKSVGDKLDELRRQFEQRGLSLDRPWLNPGSVDRYEFPFPVA